LVASGLNKQLENHALAIDGAPQIHFPPRDRDYHPVEMPAAVGFWPGLTQVAGDYRRKFENPATDRFIADRQSALSQEIFDGIDTSSKFVTAEFRPFCRDQAGISR
jgi:hypothetical protein